MIRNLLIGALALFWGAAIFVVGLHVNFPSQALMERARWEVQDRSDGAYALDAVDARLWRLTGLQVEDAVLYKVPPRARGRNADEDGPKAMPLVRVDSLAARVRLLPLLTGKQELGFLAEIFGGELDGSVTLDGTKTVVDAVGTKLDLARMPIEGKDWAVDASGLARLVVDLSTDSADMKSSKGTMSLTIDDLKLNGATAMGMTFDQQFDFSDAVLEFDVDDGKATVSKGSFVSDQLTAKVEGDLTLNDRGFSKWRMKLDLQITLGDELEQMAKFAGIGDARDDDGVYHFSCTGSLGSPNCRADGVASGKRSTTQKGRNARVRSGRAAAAPGADGGPEGMLGEDGPDGGGDESREARRERRLERLRERRERLRADGDGGDSPNSLSPPNLGGGPIGGGPRSRVFDRAEVLDEAEDPTGDDFEDQDFQDQDFQDQDFEDPGFQDDFEDAPLPAEEEFFEE